MHKDRFKGVHFFEDDMYTGMSKYSSKILTEARYKGNRDKDILLTSRPVSGFMIGVAGFLSVLLIIQSGVVVFKNSMQTVHFLSQDFRSGTNIFCSIKRAWMTAFLAEIGWLEFQSRWKLEIWSELSEYLVYKNEMLPSLPRASIVNLM